MKVLYFVGHYRNFTGSQRSLAILVRNLPPEVERVAVFPGEGRATEEFRAQGVRTVVLQAPPALDVFGGELLHTGVGRAVPLAAKELLPYTKACLELLRRERPTVVHCNDSRAVLLIGLAARAARVPLIWHLRGENVLNGWLDRVARSLSTCVVSVADAVAPDPGPRLPVATVYNAAEPFDVDVDEARAEADQCLRERGLDPGTTKRIVTASSLHPYKGLHHLAEALGRLMESDSAWRGRLAWLVLGDDSGEGQQRYRRHVQALADSHGLGDALIWLGWQPTPLRWISAADVVVLPTIEDEVFTFDDDGTEVRVRCMEGLPRTVLEAMTAGRPTVASAVAGVEELIVDGETGVVVPPSDPEALRRALATLLADPALADSLGERARVAVADFSIPATVGHMMTVYRRVGGDVQVGAGAEI